MKDEAKIVMQALTTCWSLRKRRLYVTVGNNKQFEPIVPILPIDLLITNLVRVDKQASEFLQHSATQALTSQQQDILIAQFSKLLSQPKIAIVANDYEQIFTFYDNAVAEYLLLNMPSVAIRFFLDHFNLVRVAVQEAHEQNPDNIIIPGHIINFIDSDSTLTYFLNKYPQFAVALLTNPIFISEVFLWNNMLSETKYPGAFPFQVYIMFLSRYIDNQDIKNLLCNSPILLVQIKELLDSIPAEIQHEIFERLEPLITFLVELDTAENSSAASSVSSRSSPSP